MSEGTNPISPKVTWTGTAQIVAQGIVVVISLIWPNLMTTDQQLAIQAALAVLVTFLVGYLVPDSRRSHLSATPDAVIQSYEQAVNDLEPRTGRVDSTISPDELDPGAMSTDPDDRQRSPEEDER